MKDYNSQRRKVLKSLGALFLALGFPAPFKKLLAAGNLRNVPSGSKKYNVLFMTADDIGWKDLSIDGNQNIKTPNLDKLSEEGIRFENAFGVTSSCSSSRASFITGQYISTHGVDGLTHRHPKKQLSPFHKTLADYFKQLGYHTAIQGKWHVAPFFPTSFYGYLDSLGSSLPWKRHIKNTKQIKKYFRASSKNKRPFYLELNFTDTHRSASGSFPLDHDFVVNPEKITIPKWMGLPNEKEIREDVAKYYGKVQRTDYLVGQTLSLLKEYGLEENTLVVFVSDNGSPFPGNKMSILDRGIGTPLFMKLPGKIPSNLVSKELVSSIDIMPTVLDLCKVKYSENIEGKSLTPLFTKDSHTKHREYVLAEMNYHVHSIPMRAIRTDKWKAILNLSDSPLGLDDLHGVDWAMKLCERDDQPWLRPRVPFELYDLENDPHETSNLAGDPKFKEIEDKFKNDLSENWVQLKLNS